MRTQVYLLLIHREKYSSSLQFLPFPAITSQKTLQGCHTYSHALLMDYSLLSKAGNLSKSTTFMLKNSTQQHSILFTMMVKVAKTRGRLSSREAELQGTDPHAAAGGDQPQLSSFQLWMPAHFLFPQEGT